MKNLFFAPDQLTYDALQAAKYVFLNTFSLNLPDGVFHADKTLRILPRKRLIAFGEWNGLPVVAKIFFNHKRAKRHLKTEVEGVNALLSKNLATPSIYYQGPAADDRLSVVIFERLVQAKPFEQIWKTKSSVESVLPQIEWMLAHFARHHELGILQHDPNLKNYMIENDTVYLIDCADVEDKGRPVELVDAIKNLAIFLSQFGRELTPYISRLYQSYAANRQIACDEAHIVELNKRITQHTKGRLQRLEKRIFNECRYFSLLKSKTLRGVVDRRYAAPQLLTYLNQPKNESGEIKLDNREFRVNCYPHSLKQILLSWVKPSPARLAWQAMNVDHFLGKVMEKPVAYLERKCLGIAWASYYIAEIEPAFEVV